MYQLDMFGFTCCCVLCEVANNTFDNIQLGIQSLMLKCHTCCSLDKQAQAEQAEKIFGL